MKKIISSLIFSLFFCLAAIAVDYTPKYKSSLSNCGIGLYFGEGKATVYQEPNEKSQILAKLSWDANTVDINGEKTDPKNVFAIFSPQKSLSGFIALDEIGTEYTKIIYNHSARVHGQKNL